MSTPNCTLYIVRHGESLANVDNIFGGDYPLSPTGQLQAAALATQLAGIHFDAIFTSDLVRTQQTVAQIANEQALQITTLAALRERHYGDFENKSIKDLSDELRAQLRQSQDLSEDEHWFSEYPPKAETNDAAATRFITKLREISIAWPGKTVLIGSHGNLLRILLAKLGYASFKQLPSGSIANTAIVKLHSDGVDFFIEETIGVSKIAIG